MLVLGGDRTTCIYSAIYTIYIQYCAVHIYGEDSLHQHSSHVLTLETTCEGVTIQGCKQTSMNIIAYPPRTKNA